MEVIIPHKYFKIILVHRIEHTYYIMNGTYIKVHQVEY